MNAIAFGTKRAFHGFLRVTRRPFASVGLTAARFDLLAVVYRTRSSAARSNGLLQSDLRRALGVTAPVVTRMLRALLQLGWVKRERVEHDRRQWRIRLTDDGLTRIGAIHRVMLRGVQRWVDVAICFGRHRDRNVRFRNMASFESYLHALRLEFGDGATHAYPWGHPDD
jgi:DNA-binding MarR family transcriptional regulator